MLYIEQVYKDVLYIFCENQINLIRWDSNLQCLQYLQSLHLDSWICFFSPTSFHFYCFPATAGHLLFSFFLWASNEMQKQTPRVCSAFRLEGKPEMCSRFTTVSFCKARQAPRPRPSLFLPHMPVDYYNHYSKSRKYDNFIIFIYF